VTAIAEIHVHGLILCQQITLRRRVRLMAGQAGHRVTLWICRVHGTGNGVLIRRVPQSIPKRQHRRPGSPEVVFLKPHAALKDRDQICIVELLRISVWPMTLQAQAVYRCHSEQVFVITPMRLMAGCASLPKRWLVQVRLLHLIGLVAVARQARRHRIRLEEARSFSSVRVVARSAIPQRSRMLHLGGVNLFPLVVVAGKAQRAGVGIRQHHLVVLRRLMTAVAHLIFEREVQERLHQLRLR